MFRKLRFLPIFMILLAMVLVAFSPNDNVAEAANKIADGIFLGDTDLSGMTMSEAAGAMEKYYKTIANSKLTIYVRNIPADALARMENGEPVDTEQYDLLTTVQVPVSTFGFEYSIEEALRQASTLGQTGKLVERYKLLMDMKFASAQLPLTYSVDGEKVKDYVENVFVPENTKEPKDAGYTFAEGRVIATSVSEDGIKVNANLTANAILQAFEQGISDSMSCTAVVGTSEPRITTEAINSITGVVATFTTNFWTYDNEANENRSHNIMMAAKLVNGTLLMPGERLSLNQKIGERTEERGFKVGHAYLDGQVIDSVGGGICQFATTLYQCVLQTELQVNVRYNHSMMVDYVGYSQDATLDWGNKDVVFTNTWDYPIYIICGTTFGYPSTVSVTFYSTDDRPKNRTVEYKSVVDVKKSYNAKIVYDWNLNPGTPVVEGLPLDEVSSHLEKIVRVNGVVQSTTVMNKDYYRPLRQTITVGAKGTNLSTKWDGDIHKMYDGDGNQLLMDNIGAPYYNGYSGYLLAKDYQHDANGYSTSATPVRIAPWTPPTQPVQPTQPVTTEAPTTEAPTTEAPTTEAPTSSDVPTAAPTTEAPTEGTPAPTECEHSWYDNYSHNSDETHTHTRTCTKCKATETVSENEACSFAVKEIVAATCTTGGHTVFKCSLCGYEKWGDETPAAGHHYENGVCTVCGAADPNYTTAAPVSPGEGGEPNP